MSARAVALLLLLAPPACVPVLVGGLILKSSKSNAEKREFITQLQNTNMERERQGLKSLDVCSEKYKFDQGWAAEDPVCLERIKRYQAGDQNALDMGTMGPAKAPQDSGRATVPPPPHTP
jgi:hypothetical protein